MSQDSFSISFPYLETDRLRLRQTTQKDIESVFAIFADPKVTQFHNLDTFIHIDEAIRVIETRAKGFKSDRGIRWGITRKYDDYLIGSCGFTWNEEATAAEIGYELASQFWRQGIMSEALCAILKYGFEIRKLQFIIAKIMLKNIASRKLLQKLGFQSQGVFKNEGFWKGKHHDLERFMLAKNNLIT